MADQPSTPAGSPEDKPAPESIDTPAAETAAAVPPTTGTPAADAPAPATAPAAAPYGVAGTTGDRRAWLRAKAPLMAAAAALVLVSGLGGFAIGHAAADDGRPEFRPADFTGQGPSRDQQGPPAFRGGERGQFPQQGPGDESS